MRITSTDKFWLVTNPTPLSVLIDICGETTLEGFCNQVKGGLTVDMNPTIFTDRYEAEREAMRRLRMCKGRADVMLKERTSP